MVREQLERLEHVWMDGFNHFVTMLDIKLFGCVRYVDFINGGWIFFVFLAMFFFSDPCFRAGSAQSSESVRMSVSQTTDE